MPWGNLLQRSALRKNFRTARSALAHSARAAAEAQINTTLWQMIAAEKPTTICAYLGRGGEVELGSICDPQLHRSTRLALPRVAGKEMHFHLYQVGDELLANQWDILEPESTALKVPASNIDLMLLPLVAFDAQGNRLGMGGGYYDRYLAELAKPPRLVGVAFALQQTEHLLPSEAWDIPLDAVVTEQGMLEFHNPRP